MPFTANASVISTQLDNMLRGLYRDNFNHSHTGDTNPADLASTTITGGTIGSAGMLRFFAAGDTTGGAGTKVVTIYLGATSLGSATISATTGQEWVIEGWIFNTASSAQRISIVAYQCASGGTGQAFMTSNFYTTASVDTSANQTFKLSVTNASAADTTTQRIFNILVCQIQ